MLRHRREILGVPLSRQKLLEARFLGQELEDANDVEVIVIAAEEVRFVRGSAATRG